jgi:hypothetical protein
VTESQAAQSNGPVLRVDALAKRFGDRIALHDVSFELRAGELVAVRTAPARRRCCRSSPAFSAPTPAASALQRRAARPASARAHGRR